MPIVILCQGEQTRLHGKIAVRKQLLLVAGEPILSRTLRLCREAIGNALVPIVVGWPDFPPEYRVVTNPNPGHCVLDGIRWALDYLGGAEVWVFLLGDVVFSRRALARILVSALDQSVYDTYVGTDRFVHESQFFAVTKDLGRGSGEVFAFVTHGQCIYETRIALETVPCLGLETGKYQPGHLRNLLFRLMEMRGLHSDQRPAEYHSSLCLEVDDYTTDIDTMEDVERLGELSKAVLAEPF